jgi:hypothetical protein
MNLNRYSVIAPRPPPAYPAAFSDENTSLTDSLRALLSKTEGPCAAPRRRRERRATPRVQMELCCEDLSSEAPSFRITFDLSTFGVSTRCGQTQPIGEELWLRLHLPDDLRHPLDVRVAVVGRHEESGGMRLAFRSPPADAVRRIHKYLFGKTGRRISQA